jgi:rare lipoprotein A
LRKLIGIGFIALLLSGCMSGGGKPGGYFEDDGPHKEIPVDLANIPDAVPRWEPIDPTRSRAYVVLGKRYQPMTDARNYRELGVASWYGKKFHGRRTALGETYDMYAMTAAHKTLPLPSYVRVRNLANNRSVVVRVNDRGPFLHKRLIDLSYVAAHKLDMLKTGTANVEVIALTPGIKPAPAGNGVQVATVNANAGDGIQVEALPAPESAAVTTTLDNDSAKVASLGNKAVYVQVGAFSAAENAEKLREQLEQADFRPVLVLPVQKATQQLFRVRVGPLDNASQGESMSRRLSEFGIADPRVVTE